MINQSFHSAETKDWSKNIYNFVNSWTVAENSMNDILG